MHVDGQGDHTLVSVEWPRQRLLPMERRPVPRTVAEDGHIPVAMRKLRDAARIDKAAEDVDHVRRWRTHKQLMREASGVVRERRELAGGDGAQAEGRHELRQGVWQALLPGLGGLRAAPRMGDGWHRRPPLVQSRQRKQLN